MARPTDRRLQAAIAVFEPTPWPVDVRPDMVPHREPRCVNAVLLRLSHPAMTHRGSLPGVVGMMHGSVSPLVRPTGGM